DGAYFVGRREVLAWLNATLALALERVEDSASGAAACQLTDMLFPGTVAMQRVDWAARSEAAMVGNYKLLQQAWRRARIDKVMDVPRLVRAKHADNLEFMQWFKAFFE
ncbi:calponin homology domain-containing protein, partial [Pelagophyceae sp. CCMP2097]